jgi:ATP-dependent Clp protease protease subunit
MASLICAQLLFLESENPKKDIAMYINSPGGRCHLRRSRSTTPCNTSEPGFDRVHGHGGVHGFAAALRRRRGSRIALPNARIMVHQPSGGFRGQASDIERHAEDIIATKRRLNEIYVKHTGQPYDVIEKTLDRDHFMSADQAKAFGIVDHVYDRREQAESDGVKTV